MSPLDIPELDLDGLKPLDVSDIQLHDIPDIEIQEFDFSDLEMEFGDIEVSDFDSLKFDLEHDADIQRMKYECEQEFTALTAEDMPESPAPTVTGVKADRRRKAERPYNERKKKKQGSSKAAD